MEEEEEVEQEVKEDEKEEESLDVKKQTTHTHTWNTLGRSETTTPR